MTICENIKCKTFYLLVAQLLRERNSPFLFYAGVLISVKLENSKARNEKNLHFCTFALCFIYS